MMRKKFQRQGGMKRRTRVLLSTKRKVSFSHSPCFHLTTRIMRLKFSKSVIPLSSLWRWNRERWCQRVHVAEQWEKWWKFTFVPLAVLLLKGSRATEGSIEAFSQTSSSSSQFWEEVLRQVDRELDWWCVWIDWEDLGRLEDSCLPHRPESV